jgi:hypothetical protein
VVSLFQATCLSRLIVPGDLPDGENIDFFYRSGLIVMGDLPKWKKKTKKGSHCNGSQVKKKGSHCNGSQVKKKGSHCNG